MGTNFRIAVLQVRKSLNYFQTLFGNRPRQVEYEKEKQEQRSNAMPQQKLSLSYSDVERGIYKLSIEEQLKLTEIIFANLKTALRRQPDTEKEDQNGDLSQFCGKWQDDRSAQEIVSQIYADRAKSVRSEKVVS